MIRTLAATLALLLASAGPSAQHAGLPVTVQADRVLIGPVEFLPRCGLGGLIIPAGEIYTVAPNEDRDCIEVAGTLFFSQTWDTTLRFRTLYTLPGGHIEAQTARRVDLIVADVPIDTAADPFQWGHGIINFGRVTIIGPTKTPFAQMAPVQAGSTGLALDSAPSGWLSGDELLMPDLRQHNQFFNDPARARLETPVTIAAINGQAVALSKGLDFEHLSINYPDGTEAIRPRVANLTRNIRIRSENPNGTRGHFANVGMDATDHVEGVEFVGIGRTQNEPTGVNNQIGRYAYHNHHQGGASLNRGNVFRNSRKWAVAVHGVGTDKVVEDAVCVDSDGGCLVTEDGPEVGVVFRRNFVAYVFGNPARRNAALNAQQQCAGCEGSGIWLRGLKDAVIDGNEVWNSEVGINIFNIHHIGLPFPAAEAAWASIDGNVTVGNRTNNLEFWGGPDTPVTNHVAANASVRQVWAGASVPNFMTLEGLTVLCSPDEGRAPNHSGVDGNSAYVPNLRISGGFIGGCKTGIGHGAAIVRATIQNVTLQNAVNIVYTTNTIPQSSLFENVTHVPFRNLPPRYLELWTDPVWQPGQPESDKFSHRWRLPLGSTIKVVSWQGDGQTYRIGTPQMGREAPAWLATPTHPIRTFLPPPVCGSTMGETWDNCGLSFNGESVDLSLGLAKEGLHNAVLIPGGEVELGPPRYVITTPNELAEATVEPNGRIILWGVISGDPDGVTDDGWASIDGGAPVKTETPSASFPTRRVIRTTVMAPGTHTVRTWRQTATGQAVNEMTFTYCVGECGEPPPPPPPVTWTPLEGTLQQGSDGSLRFCPAGQPESACFVVIRGEL